MFHYFVEGVLGNFKITKKIRAEQKPLKKTIAQGKSWRKIEKNV